jgi:IS30 family transposase
VGKRITDEKKAEIIALRSDKLTMAEITKKAGVSMNTVVRVLKQPKTRKPYTKKAVALVEAPVSATRPMVALIGTPAEIAQAVQGMFS